jgi:5,10-methylenetetrahydromethanopterin reductase
MKRFALSMGLSSREPIQRVQDVARAAESYGLDCLWLLDSHLVMKDVYVSMTLAALATRTLKFGTGVTTPLNRHPTATATAISAVSEVSDGRVTLGIGTGDSAVKPLGFQPATSAEMERIVVELRKLLRGEEAVFSDTQPKPLRLGAARRDVPVFVGAGGPKMLRVGGRVADGVIVMGPNHRNGSARRSRPSSRGPRRPAGAGRTSSSMSGSPCRSTRIGARHSTMQNPGWPRMPVG